MKKLILVFIFACFLLGSFALFGCTAPTAALIGGKAMQMKSDSSSSGTTYWDPGEKEYKTEYKKVKRSYRR